MRTQTTFLVREEKPVTLPEHSEPEPDIALVKPRRYREAHPYPTDVLMIIEVADSEEDLAALAAAVRELGGRIPDWDRDKKTGSRWPPPRLTGSRTPPSAPMRPPASRHNSRGTGGAHGLGQRS